jgi:hypothetical protein
MQKTQQYIMTIESARTSSSNNDNSMISVAEPAVAKAAKIATIIYFQII